MESFIRNYRAAKNEPPYVGIVHRRDQPVEGVMVFAKIQKAAASLSWQIKEHTTEKYYRAASRGQGAVSYTHLDVYKRQVHYLENTSMQRLRFREAVISEAGRLTFI